MPPKKKDDKKKGGKEGELTPEDKFKQEVARVENEKTDLGLELSFTRDKLQQKTATADSLELELLELGAKLDKSTQDYMDILEHKEVQLKGTEKRVYSLEQQVQQLQTELCRMEDRMATLVTEADVHKAQLESSAGILGQQQQLEEAARRQDSVIARQEEEMNSLKGQIGSLHQQLTVSADKSVDLALKASGTTELKILFGEAWLVGLTRQRLLGEIPSARDGNTLCCFGGRLLVMYGGQARVDSSAGISNGGLQRQMNPLQLDNLTWSRPLGGKAADFVNCHSAVSVARTKMMAFGGQRGQDILDGVSILHTDSMKWVTPVIRGASAPTPRIRHAAACCRDKVFIFGGQDEGGVLLNDMWEWHMDTLHWTPVRDFQNGANQSTEPPSARAGASLCASEDGRRLWLFGGNAGSGSLNDLHFMDLETHTWTQVTVSGNSPTAREGHAACILSRFMLISTGMHTAGSGSERRLADTHILDLGTLTWDCLDEGHWANGVVWKQTLGQYCVFHGNRLYIFKPSKDDRLDELLTLEFTLPEDIERLKTEKRKGNMIYDTLDIMSEASCTSNSIEVSWRPPTKNSERIAKFKLMLATTTGVVKEVYQGLHTRFRSSGLRPDMEYIFCVKATYDDGSYAWSESKAFQTRA